MVRALVAMSGGVDSSVAAVLALDAGHEVVGATMKLWGGESDSGCCSVSDVEDARRVANRLGIDHHIFNFTEEFDRHVVDPYVAAHAAGRTPNPCIECNRHLKFDAFLQRALRLGFDLVVTGHHARVVTGHHARVVTGHHARVVTGTPAPSSGAAVPATGTPAPPSGEPVPATGAPALEPGRPRLLRGADSRKDQSYVLSCLTAAELSHVWLPVGELSKDEVRRIAGERRLATATKPDSQDVCFIAGGSGAAPRRRFLEDRMDLHPGVVVDGETGAVLGEVPAVELVTVGQRKGLGVAAGERRFAVAVDVAARTVVLGDESALRQREVALEQRTWTGHVVPIGTPVLVQSSAHGSVTPAEVSDEGVRLLAHRRRIARGQTVALYDNETGNEVLGAGIAC